MGKTVHDVIVRFPQTHSPETSVAGARRALDEDDHIHMLLITERGRLLGTLVREDLPPEAADSSPAMDYAHLAERTIPPGVSAEQALRLLCARDERRRAVVDADGYLLGLLCLKRSQTGFCSDADVQARAADREGDAQRGSSPPCPDPADAG